MKNNNIFRRLRYVLDYNDLKTIKIFEIAGYKASREQIYKWSKKEEEEEYELMPDYELSNFLNGLIVENRGKSDDKLLITERKLNNNLILKKLKIALKLNDEDIQEIYKLVNLRVSNNELRAFFRSPTHERYSRCKDQFLRNFLYGLQIKLRPDTKDEIENI